MEARTPVSSERSRITLKGHTSYFWWRVITALALTLALASLVLMPFLYLRINDAVKTNEEVIATSQKVLCSFGDLVQFGGGSRQEAIKGPHSHLEAELDFLTGIRDSECRLIEEHPAVKRELQKTIDLIQFHLTQHPGG